MYFLRNNETITLMMLIKVTIKEFNELCQSLNGNGPYTGMLSDSQNLYINKYCQVKGYVT